VTLWICSFCGKVAYLHEVDRVGRHTYKCGECIDKEMGYEKKPKKRRKK